MQQSPNSIVLRICLTYTYPPIPRPLPHPEFRFPRFFEFLLTVLEPARALVGWLVGWGGLGSEM